MKTEIEIKQHRRSRAHGRTGVPARYDYAPFGAVTASGDVTQPFQWSSEFYDSELGLVYYNYRHYSPADGRFLSRDPIEEQGGLNLYAISKNDLSFDILGLRSSFEVINRSIYGATSQHPVPPTCEKINECRWRITTGGVISTPIIVADSANYTLRGPDGLLYRATCKRLSAGMEATRKHEEAHIRYAEQGVARINSELGLPKEFETDYACQGELRNVLSAWNKKYSILEHENVYHLGDAPKPTPPTFEQEYAAGLCKVEKL